MQCGKAGSADQPGNRQTVYQHACRSRHLPAGASPEKSTYVAQAVDVIRQSGLPSETNAMFTNIEGDIDDVLKVIRDATMKLAGQGYRTDVVIRLDIRPGFEGQIHAKQALVDEILSE